MKFFIALFAVLPTLCLADVYKCQKDGKTVFQESPCATGKGVEGGKVDLKYQKIADDPKAENLTQEQRERFDNLIAQRRVAIGMTAKMVERSWGKPDRINVNIGSWGRSEQWIYGKSASPDIIYVDNGIVSSAHGHK